MSFVDYDYRCPKCGAGTFLYEKGLRICANIGGLGEDEGCNWSNIEELPIEEFLDGDGI